MLNNSGHKRIALLFDLSVGYCRDVLEGIQRFARARNDWVYFDAPPTMESQHALRAYHPHGIIAHVFDADFAREIVGLGVPAVTSTSTLIDCGVPIVEVDHWQVGRMAAEFFVARGFRRFGFFGSSWTHFSRAREAAFIEKVTQHGGTCDSCYEEFLPRRIVIQESESMAKTTELWLQRLLSAGEPVAVFAANDMPARYLTSYCWRLGIRIPQDLSLLSADNDRYECRLAFPSLSSIELPAVEIGQRAAALLERLMAGHKPPASPQWLPPLRIVTRGSTDALAYTDGDVNAFFAYLRDSFGETLTAERICKQIGIGRRTLERKLHDVLGTTIGQELSKRRMAESQRLLLESKAPISQVALESGFSSPERFAKVFRKIHHMTPSQYRTMGGGGPRNVDFAACE